MKQLKTLLAQLLVITSLMLPWATTEALETFQQAGAITGYSHDKFMLNQQVFRIRPDTVYPSGSRPSYKAFKKGDEVYIEGKVLNGIRYVDKMIFYPPEPS